MLTVTAFSDLTSLLNNHCNSPRSVAPVGVYTDTDQWHLVRNEQLRVVNFVQLKKRLHKKSSDCVLCFFYCMNVNDRQEQWSRIYNLLFYTFFNNYDLLYDLFWSSSFEQINLLTKKHLGFFPDCQVLQCVWVYLLYPAHFTPMEPRLRYVYPQKCIRIFKDPKHVLAFGKKNIW